MLTMILSAHLVGKDRKGCSTTLPNITWRWENYQLKAYILNTCSAHQYPPPLCSYLNEVHVLLPSPAWSAPKCGFSVCGILGLTRLGMCVKTAITRFEDSKAVPLESYDSGDHIGTTLVLVTRLERKLERMVQKTWADLECPRHFSRTWYKRPSKKWSG